MAIKLPSIPEPGNDPASQLNTLRAIKQVVDLLAANATGDKNTSGPSVGAQIFALQDDVKQLMKDQTAALTGAIDQNKQDATWTVEQAVSSLNQDISDARNKAIQARSDALTALDSFEQNVAQTILDINSNIDGVKASVKDEAGARATADDAQAGRITKAAAFMGLNESSWKQGDLSVATRFSAMSTGYKEYVAKTNDNFLAGYTSQIVTLAGIDTAISTAVSNLEAKITIPSTPGRSPTLLYSAILTEQNSVVDATQKLVTAQNLQTTVASLSDVAGQNGKSKDGAITAAVKVESDARVKLVNDGGTGTVDTKLKNVLSTAQYSVVVSTTGYAGPAITGFRAVSDSSGYTPISDFQIFADKFKITSGSTSKQVFAVDALTQNVQIAGDLVVTGSISSGAISNTQGSQYSTTGNIVTKVFIRRNARVLVLVSSQGETFTNSSTVSGVFATDASITSENNSVTYAYNRVTNNVSYSQLPVNSTHLEYQYNFLTNQWQWVSVTTTSIIYTYFVGAATNNLYWQNTTGVDAYFNFNMAYYSNSINKPCQVSLLVLELAR